VLGERLLGSFERIIEGAGGGDGAGEIRERDAEVAIFVSVDQGNVMIAHLSKTVTCVVRLLIPELPLIYSLKPITLCCIGDRSCQSQISQV
jgi:hypothetical protein